MEAHERARLRKYQATPTDITEEQRKLTGPNSAFINCIRDTIRATPGTYESLVQLLLSMESEMLDTTSDTNNSSPRSEWSSVTMVAPPRSPMQELPRARRMVPGVFLGSYTNTYVPGPVYTNCDWTGTMPSFEQWQTVVEYDDRMDVDAHLEASSVHQTEEQEQYEPMEIEMDVDGEEQQEQQQSEDQQQRPGEQQHAEEQNNAEEQQHVEEGQHQQGEQPEEQHPFHPQPSPTAAQPSEHAEEQYQQQQEEQQEEPPVCPQPSRPQHSPTAAQSNENAEDQQEEQTVHPQSSQPAAQPNEQAAPASQPDAQPALPAPDFLADPFAGTESRTNQFIRTMGEAAMLIRELRYGCDYVQSGALIPSTSCEGYQEFRRRLEAGMRMSPHNSMKKCFDEVEICLEMIVDCLVVAQVLEMVQNWSAWGVNPFG